MIKLAERLQMTDIIFPEGVPTTFQLEVLNYNAPLWALHSMSLQHSFRNSVYIAYNQFHTHLSMARQYIQLAHLAGYTDVKSIEQYVLRGLAVDVQQPKVKKALFKIAHTYNEDAMAQLEYVHHARVSNILIFYSRDRARGLDAKFTLYSAYRPEFTPYKSNKSAVSSANTHNPKTLGKIHRRLLQSMIEEAELQHLLVQVCVLFSMHA